MLRRQCLRYVNAEFCATSAVAEAGEFYEFFLADRKGEVKHHYRRESQDEPAFHLFGAANLPEPGQAWTISAVIRVVNEWHRAKNLNAPRH